MEGGKSQNYWPGFVDALSNVVLTLVFVLVIFVFALAMASNKVEQKRKEVSQATQKQQSALQQENAKLKDEVSVMTKQLEALKGNASASDHNNTGAANQQAVSAQNDNRQIAIDNKMQPKASNQGPVEIKNATNKIILSFPLSVAEMDEKSKEQLGHVLEAIQKTTGTHKVLLRSIVGRETYSVARRMAYYRAMNARSSLITKLGYAPSDIEITVVTPLQPEDGIVEIIPQK